MTRSRGIELLIYLGVIGVLCAAWSGRPWALVGLAGIVLSNTAIVPRRRSKPYRGAAKPKKGVGQSDV